MRVKARLKNLAGRALAESMDVKTMVHFTRRLLGNYDLHRRTGFPESVPIPNKDAARQIVEDMIAEGRFLEFVEHLIDVERRGMAGRKYRVPRLSAIIAEIVETGYALDSETNQFVEDAGVRKTRNWGVLHEGETYVLCFLGVDIVGNSRLVRAHGREAVAPLYEMLRTQTQLVVERRNGRLWSWEGDGGIAAFAFAERNRRAVLAGIELLHELFVYNILHRPLGEGLRVRLTVHNGSCEYNDGDAVSSDTVTRLWRIDRAYGRPNTLTITDTVYPTIEPSIADHFKALEADEDLVLYQYGIREVAEP